MTKRSLPLAIVLSFVTLGVYAFYWIYALTEDAHAAAGERTTASGGMVILFSLITCGIYSLYWLYKMGETIIMAKQKRGMAVDTNLPIIYLVLALFGLGIVSYALMQNALNDIIDYDGGASKAF
ncbi:DUF4234 domain-containing protein [uncultured Selenomonas sp.]|jgi:hypothetical protein|uniref:DUF4234 domain-containing protein n=1 Tax=uncultured Selenomonas sp. TaxID=159275 RepID=UPI00263287B8|nr:DUF4234 domain-containing protein [uncultured Selenomonas sp.]